MGHASAFVVSNETMEGVGGRLTGLNHRLLKVLAHRDGALAEAKADIALEVLVQGAAAAVSLLGRLAGLACGE